MSVFFAIMAMIGMLTTLYLLSYPVGWIIDQTFGRALVWAWRTRRELDSAYRD